MIIPLLRTNGNLLRALPNYLLRGVCKNPKYYLDIGRVDTPYVWFVRYRNEDMHNTLYIVHDRSLRKAVLKMLDLLKKNKGEYVDF